MKTIFSINKSEAQQCLMCTHSIDLEGGIIPHRVHCDSQKCQIVLKRFPYLSEKYIPSSEQKNKLRKAIGEKAVEKLYGKIKSTKKGKRKQNNIENYL